MTSTVTIIPTPDKKQQTWSTNYKTIGVIACIGGLLFQLVTGSNYQWGIINIYVTSYYKTMDPSITLQANAVAFPIMMFSMGLPMRLGIYLAEVTHPLFMMITCQVLLSISVFLSSYMTSMWAFIFFYGILFGLLVGSVFMIPIIQCNKYFPGMKNYVNGVILIGTGSGSVVFGTFSYSYLNPQRLKPLLGYYLGTSQLEQIALRVPTLLKFLSLMYLCIGLLGIAMMAPVFIGNKRKQNEQKQKQKIIRQQNERNGIATTEAQKPQSPRLINDHQAHSLKQAFMSRICWIEVFIVLLVACGLYFINGNYKTYVKKTINDDYFLTIIGVVSSVGNGCSRFLWNVLFLKTGYKTVMLIILGVAISVYSTIRFTVQMKEIYFIQVFLINCCIGGLLVTTPTVTQAIYGQKTGSNIYAFYWQIVASANFLQYLYVSNLSKTIGFDNIIYICLGMTCLAVPIVIFTTFEGPWRNQIAALQFCVGIETKKAQDRIDATLQQFQEQLEHQHNKETVVELPQAKKQLKLQPLNKQFKQNNKKKLDQVNPQFGKSQISNGNLMGLDSKQMIQHQSPSLIEHQKKNKHNQIASDDK